MNVLSCGPKTSNISEISDGISPRVICKKSSHHVRACIAGDGAICSKNRKNVPYHGDNPNTRNGARLRSSSPIMAPAKIYKSVFEKVLSCQNTTKLFSSVIANDLTKWYSGPK